VLPRHTPTAIGHLNVEQGTGNDGFRMTSLEGSSRQPSTVNPSSRHLPSVIRHPIKPFFPPQTFAEQANIA